MEVTHNYELEKHVDGQVEMRKTSRQKEERKIMIDKPNKEGIKEEKDDEEKKKKTKTRGRRINM